MTTAPRTAPLRTQRAAPSMACTRASAASRAASRSLASITTRPHRRRSRQRHPGVPRRHGAAVAVCSTVRPRMASHHNHRPSRTGSNRSAPRAMPCGGRSIAATAPASLARSRRGRSLPRPRTARAPRSRTAACAGSASRVTRRRWPRPAGRRRHQGRGGSTERPAHRYRRARQSPRHRQQRHAVVGRQRRHGRVGRRRGRSPLDLDGSPRRGRRRKTPSACTPAHTASTCAESAGPAISVTGIDGIGSPSVARRRPSASRVSSAAPRAVVAGAHRASDEWPPLARLGGHRPR